MNNHNPDQTLAASVTDNLIPVFTTDIGGVAQTAVNARELHGFLGSKQDFSSWIKRRLTEYGFVDQVDYQAITKFSDGYKQDKNGRLIDQYGKVVPIEYHLTLDTAKELAMVEKNEKGREARRYFINCERQLHAQAHIETQQPKLSDDISLFTPLEDVVDEYQWQIHKAIEARVLLLALKRLTPCFSTNKIDLRNFLLLTDLMRSYSLQLNKIIEKDLKVPRNGEYKQTADVMRQVMLFIGKWIPSEIYAPTCFFPEFGFQTPEGDGKSPNK